MISYKLGIYKIMVRDIKTGRLYHNQIEKNGKNLIFILNYKYLFSLKINRGKQLFFFVDYNLNI